MRAAFWRPDRRAVGNGLGGQDMSVAFDERVLKMIESEVRTIKAQYRGQVSEE